MNYQKSTIRKAINTGLDYLSSIFFNGLFTILPITLTFALLNVSFKLLKSWLEPVYNNQPIAFQLIPHSEIILVFLVIFIVGTIVKFMIIRSLVHNVEAMITRLPLVRPIYTGIKQLVNAFSSNSKNSFQQVVLVEFPRKGIYSIGFLTSQHPQELAPEAGHTYYNVFVPTTPNPTTGFYFIAHQDEVKLIDLTRQEAMAIIISGGIITPERFAAKNDSTHQSS